MLLNQILKKNNYFILALFILLSSVVKSNTNFDYFDYIDNLQSFSATFSQYTYNQNDNLIKKSNGNITYKKKI